MSRLGAIERWVPRSQWDAAPADCVTSLPIESVRRVFVHYTASFADLAAAHADCARRWKATQTFHMSRSPSDPSKPWCDVAYTIGVCPHGWAFEGRGLGRRTGATGACNDDSYAIVFMGHDKVGRQDVGSAARETVAECVAELERRKKARLLVKGHRDCGSTACPGDELYTWIRSAAFRRLVNAQKAGGELKTVWQCRAGGKVLRQIRAGDVKGVSALDRLLEWMKNHEARIREAEREHGAVAIRAIKVPA